ncbi:MAG: nitrite reductase large subunit NirB [Thalassolituus sp.]|jgi:nitrite reductase (NADH) large subunit|uniref:nitrite reductase large subunit NirB n=1 Tax=unclassified Thalassolituus TaxID=2624967 RepID=UPI000C0DA0A1|nr:MULTISPECIES: nitrite reductase large subunit NirB [unclassified Thalassolituus]MBN58668.1 nitrite reductase (NAD(P)H) [Oceanospirillaceae bacterium]MDQ4423915.1 nitrite reductase large subunit NirB [Thalassolituus sp.]MDQ4425363.1 nitrite reductase large subunit NirB [Thalassolituus sp.]|tara:strand:+ start:9667 stop:12231 length:2565 start_codon:yes stop_codon:yes gene_type:complete
MSKKRIIVVGNGMVGHNFLATMAESEKASEFELITFSEEPRLAYDRVQLSKYFSGATAADLALTTESEYDDSGITYLKNEKVVEIDADNKTITTSTGRIEGYDKLVLATGSYPFVPPIPGKDQDHCLVYRTIEDLEAISASAEVSKTGVVVGGGLLGLEAANALKEAGLDTHVVEFAPRLMAVQLDEGGGNLLRHKIESLGVSVHTEKNTKEIVAGEECRYRMNFADGSHLETDMILFSAGIRPQDELARQFGIDVGERGGIVINDYCQTSEEDIYAIGECALWDSKIFGLVAPGYQMAKVTAAHITDTLVNLKTPELAFKGADMSTKLKLLGVDVASIGDAHGHTAGSQSFVFSDDIEEVYKRLIVSADGKKLLGAVLVGETESYGTLLQLMLNDMDIPGNPAALILPALGDEAPAGLGVTALPDTAQICSCYDVSKGDIASAVQGGCCTMGDIKGATKATTGCGGCAALTKQVMDSELAALGVEVNNDLCEHFAYTRAELADIVRVKGYGSFAEVLKGHGKGHGCEICKPTIGSILASYKNEYVLKDDLMPLQDTNDIFLGNMQKDGTYSVVPRVPGGEITPDKLIAIGEVAKEFDLYTKITGGQRIDLFGAQLHELPKIWEKLIAAGLETGHAYGKALRTVKSCVGSTWCRYGVLDSVSMAVALENRYKGLRAPHKIKFGVSGCTRECAEAQSKDIGVIATESGWNLYVCGNGGMRPRHADLFATDLDDETLIKYIDRVLMFYVRTADRLQRTSVWLENLEGGLDYLREVVVDNKLDICGELENDMTRVVGTYQCEWKTTVESPEKLKRFSHFINAAEEDNNLLYVRERGQRRPATDSERIELVELTTEKH